MRFDPKKTSDLPVNLDIIYDLLFLLGDKKAGPGPEWLRFAKQDLEGDQYFNDLDDSGSNSDE